MKAQVGDIIEFYATKGSNAPVPLSHANANLGSCKIVNCEVMASYQSNGYLQYMICDSIYSANTSLLDVSGFQAMKNDSRYICGAKVPTCLNKSVHWMYDYDVIGVLASGTSASKVSTNQSIIKKKLSFDGSQCKKCYDWVYMAGPNQSDGSFVCRTCREDPYHFKF